MSYIPSVGKSEFVCYIGLVPVMMVKKAGRLGFSLAVKLEGFAGERDRGNHGTCHGAEGLREDGDAPWAQVQEHHGRRAHRF